MSRTAGALAHFIMEALYVGRDREDALLRDLGVVTPLGGGRLEVMLAGQRLEVEVRAARPGMYLAAQCDAGCPDCGSSAETRALGDGCPTCRGGRS